MSDKIIKKYNNMLEKNGPTAKALGWTKNRQALRFKILIDNFNFKNGSSILDFGCGFGDLYKYLQEKEPTSLNYTGIDINKKIISEGLRMHPDADLRVLDLEKNSFEEKYDFVVSSGVFNIKRDDSFAFFEKIFEKLFSTAQVGVAINFLSDKVDFFTEDSFHFSPESVLSNAYKYSKRVILRNDYMPFEFTLVVFKDDQFDEDKVVFKEYEKYIK